MGKAMTRDQEAICAITARAERAEKERDELRAQVKRWEDKEASRGHECFLMSEENESLKAQVTKLLDESEQDLISTEEQLGELQAQVAVLVGFLRHSRCEVCKRATAEHHEHDCKAPWHSGLANLPTSAHRYQEEMELLRKVAAESRIEHNEHPPADGACACLKALNALDAFRAG